MAQAEVSTRKKVAAKQGVKPNSVYKREYRRRKSAGLTTSPTLNVWWKVPETLAVDLAHARTQQLLAVAAFGRTIRALERIRELDPAPSLDWVSRQIEQLTRAQEFLSSSTIAAACPYCKCLPIQCHVCNGSHGVSQQQLADAPKALFDEREQVVEFEGKLVPYSEAKEGLRSWMEE